MHTQHREPQAIAASAPNLSTNAFTPRDVSLALWPDVSELSTARFVGLSAGTLLVIASIGAFFLHHYMYG